VRSHEPLSSTADKAAADIFDRGGECCLRGQDDNRQQTARAPSRCRQCAQQMALWVSGLRRQTTAVD